ncbi:glucose 1-dehydrogenase [Consotaella aegiceratis]|uniref:glucose 1-dehydrogenase n=1 Tax=Consotaella aegiceratis TaxID=3097961 RepID=UPI002F413657
MTDVSSDRSDFLSEAFGLRDCHVLVTGSSAGIGFALARGFAAAGARVVLNGRTAERIDGACRALANLGFEATGAVFDVTDSAAVETAVATIVDEQGPIDILVNNAGIQHRAPLHEFPEDAFQRLIETNLTSAFRVGKAVAKGMIERRRGSIINVCSVQSELARPSIAPYAASKGGLKMLTKGMALDWGPYGIRVNGLAPGYFKTELNRALVADSGFSDWLVGRTPLKRWGEVDELAGAAIFLASDAASFVTGHILYVDGGVTGCL